MIRRSILVLCLLSDAFFCEGAKELEHKALVCTQEYNMLTLELLN